MGIWFADRAVARGGPKRLRPCKKIIADIGLGFLDELGPWNPLSIYGTRRALVICVRIPIQPIFDHSFVDC